MSDFRDRFGAQLNAAAVALAAAPEADFRLRFGAQLAVAAAELAGARAPGASPAPRRLGALLPRLLPAPRRPAADFRTRFGLQLTRAAGELAGAPVPRAGVRRRRLPWLTRPIAVGLAVTAFAGTAFAAVAIWTPLLGNPQYGYNPGAATSAPPQNQLDTLGVLRRAQTDADRGALSQAALTYINDYTKGVRTAYVRLLATVNGNAFVLVPVEERDGTQSTAGGIPSATIPLSNALCIYASNSGGQHIGVHCWSLGDVKAGRATAVFDGQLYALAPDDVSAVVVNSPGQVALSAPVAGNFFAIPLPAGAPPPVGYSLSFTRSPA